MNTLALMEYKNQRVLTTNQIAEHYGTDQLKIHQNFSNNKDKYTEGKHYYLLKGTELKAFKNSLENFEVVNPRTPHLLLWTEHGALLHAKSLGTDEAWATYEQLIETYFRAKETPRFEIPETLSQALRLAAELSEEKEKLQLENTEMKPKALFADAVLASKDAILIGDLAKLLKQNGYNTGQNRLFATLRHTGYLHKQGERYNKPTQMSLEKGIMEVKETVWVDPITGEHKISFTSKVTPKGQQYFINLFMQEEKKIAMVY